MSKKSYWQRVRCDTERSGAAVKSWFMPLCENMKPYKAEILCDIETDREKKFRVFMTDFDGKKWQFERTRGGRTFSVSMKPVGWCGSGNPRVATSSNPIPEEQTDG